MMHRFSNALFRTAVRSSTARMTMLKSSSGGNIQNTIRSFSESSSAERVSIRLPPLPKFSNQNDVKHWKNNTLPPLDETDEDIYNSVPDLSMKYELGRVTGRGRFGKVQEATCLASGNRVAVKTIPVRNFYQSKTLVNEIDILSKNKHPNLISSIETLVTPGHVHIISDFFKGGELYDRIVGRGDQYTFTKEETIIVMHQILTALEEMHENNIAHRDVKPENVMFKEKGGWELSLIDFGMAMKVNPDKMNCLSGRAGSPSYVAPEVINGNYDERADCWSAGVIMYILSCGKAPFKGNSAEDTIELIRAGCIPLVEEWTKLSDDVRDVVEGLLQKDPSNRLTAKEALEHDLFRELRNKEVEECIFEPVFGK